MPFSPSSSALWVVLLYLSSFTGTAAGQDFLQDYMPVRSYSPSAELIMGYKNRFVRWSTQAQFEQAAAKGDFVLFLFRKANFLSGLDSLGALMHSDAISEYINSVKDTIIAHNHILQDRTYDVFVYRSTEPNAFALGEGLILISLGLLERMTSVDQLAFVLAHEIGHEYYNHVYDRTYEYIRDIHEKNVRKGIKKASASKIARRSAVQEYVYGFLAEHRQYSRVLEIQADSIGYVFFQNAGFDQKAAFELLQILDSADSLPFERSLPWETVFSTDSFSFKSYWLDDTAFQSIWERDTTAGRLPDSLKTHPDCPERIERLESLRYGAAIETPSRLEENVSFQDLAPLMTFEYLVTLMQFEEWVKALYIDLRMLEHFPRNAFLQGVMIECLIELHTKLTGHGYLSIVDFPGEDFPMGYNELLTILHNINSKALWSIIETRMRHFGSDHPDHPYTGFLEILGHKKNLANASAIEEYAAGHSHDFYGGRLSKKCACR